MADELLERLEALRSLDWRLSSLSTDIEHIIDPANDVSLFAGPVSVRLNTGTQEGEGRVREELIEIAAQLRTLSSREVPDVGEAAGWGPTMENRIPELRELVERMQELVREAFAEVEAQLPAEVSAEPLADPEPYEGEVPGDHRERRGKILQAAFAATIVGLFVWFGFVDMDALRRACERPSACASDDPQISVYATGWIAVEQRGADCEERVRLLFDRDGELIRRAKPGDKADSSWPNRNLRGTGSCSEVDSMRWTWVMGTKH
jgi:hypothetical protein